MKIGIDISQIVYGTGVSVYTKELVRALLSIDTENHYILYAGVLRRKDDLNRYIKTLKGNFEYVTFPIPPRVADVLWNHLRPFRIEVLLGTPVDVLHTSDWTEPRTSARKVTTIHDLSPILYPELTHPRITRVFIKKLELVKRDKDIVIVPSVTIESELIKYGIPTSHIFCIPEAPNPELINAPHIDIKKTFKIPHKYVLMVGTAQRKNIARAYEAFKQSKLKDTVLVITGQEDADLPKESDIIYTGFVSTPELANLYKDAELFLYPSLYEGFGLPILEAFALGCPVVTSNLGSMSEVASDAAVLVNPYDTADIKKGILHALTHKATLMKKGRSHVRKYSWAIAAQKTLHTYQYAYEQR